MKLGEWWPVLTAPKKREGRTKEENVLNSLVGREFALTLLSLEMTE